MKRLLFTILALCVLCVGLQAQNTNTTNNNGVTSQGQLDTVRNTRIHPTTQDGPVQSNFVDQFGKAGQRPGLSPYGQRLKAVIKITSSSMVSNSVSATTASIAATVSDSGDYALPIIERGVCYATTANPTLLTATKVADATISGKGFGNFEVSLSGLQPHTAYHARAYAVSMYDTVYGTDLTFTTLFAGSLSYATTAVNKLSVDEAFTNPLTHTGDGTVTYAVSSGDDICTVNASTGLVTLNGNDGTCTITATVTGGTDYHYSTPTASYTLTVDTATLLQTPLTLEATTAGTIKVNNPKSGMQYNLNNGTKITMTETTTIDVAEGDKVQFFGNGTNITSYNGTYIAYGTAQVKAYGNIMSLVNETGYDTATTLTGTSTFYQLFWYNDKLTEATDLQLPATTLTSSCYGGMFAMCIHLAKAPALPAETLSTSCYADMFYQCTSLTTAPALPAETLSTSCYQNMFYQCTGLSTAPELPAMTLEESCYYDMFNGCTFLSSAPTLPATTLASSCYYQMFNGCTSLTSAPALPATTLASGCYSAMFYQCTSLTTAPTLPAETLAAYCYQDMFNGCSSLNNVTCLASDISADYCTSNWLSGVAATGTFYKASSMTSWTIDSPDGIPEGWTPTVYETQPLTFEAKRAGAVVSFGKNYPDYPEPATVTIEYSKNGGEWTTYASSITLDNVGDKVSFRGNNTKYNPNRFYCSDTCYIYGNIMSLISSEGFATATTLTESDAFRYLFRGNTTIYSHASKTLVLPAITLSSGCYSDMFSGCTGLTTAPELPAKTMANFCYSYMFDGCTGLKTAPELPAGTLAEGCYRFMFQNCTSLVQAPALPTETLAERCYTNMFSGCTSLTSAPELPAMTMKDLCYQGMFSGCSSLTTVPALPATTLAAQCYDGMFSNCTSLATAPALPATTLADFCYDGMFRGCISLTTAPVLPAKTLIWYCYQYMFKGCENLNSVTCLATNISATGCTNQWLDGVASTGTFYKTASTNWGTPGPSKIPVGWTAIPVVPGKFSVNANGDQVYFSQGNLQATTTDLGANWSWAFAENQWDYIGHAASNNCISGNGTVSTNGSVDLFGWVGASSTWTGAAQYGIINSIAINNTNGYGNVANEALKSDWGNTIGMGWRTLTKDEWTYLFITRTSGSNVNGTSNARYTQATINTDNGSGGVYGMILFPDGVTIAAEETTAWGTINGNSDWDTDTKCTSAQWTALAAKGCVFLPAAGYRHLTTFGNDSSEGYYWSSSPSTSSENEAYLVFFNFAGSLNIVDSMRFYGYSVRLVHTSKPMGFLSYAAPTVNKMIGDAAFTNPLTFTGDGTVSYAVSSGDDICTVNANTGEVTLTGNTGTCTITATVANSSSYTYATTTASYTLTVTPVGALPGKFTINANGDQVNFSMGNLQYQASTNTWRFAKHQYDYVGDATNGNVYENEVKCNNANISDSYTGWIDLLGWGTGDDPTKSTTNNGNYSNFTAWGVNPISNGGNTANLWRTLTKDEWVYLFEHHTKGWSTVNGVNGYVIRPDGISTAVAASYTASGWAVEEAAGSVFLPAAGSRGGTSVGGVGDWGDYWSSTPYNSNDAYYLYFNSSQPYPSNNTGRFGGRSVRLVSETPFLGAGTEEDPYLISSKADWNHLANKVNSGINYSGKYFRQTADINNVTSMVGVYSDPWKSPFRGTYDGDGNTLNLSINTNSSFAGPFQYIENSTVKNVITTGSVSVQYASNYHPAGLVGITTGTCTIQNCLVSANVSGAQHMGGIVGHCWTADISIIGCVYSGTLTPASQQWTGGILGWGGDGGGHTISISDCLFAGSFVYSTSNTKFHPIGILQNQSNTKNLSNTYYTLGAINTTDNESFVRDLSYKGKFARSITGGPGVTVAKAGTATAVYDVSGITSYGTGILYDGVLYAGNGEAVSLTLSHAAAPSGTTFVQHTVTGGGTLNSPTSNTPTLTMTDANQVINAEYIPQGAINGKFTINASGDQVYFSQGNLQATYNGSVWSWAFATNQWDYIGGKSSGGVGTATGNNFINGNGTMSAAGTVDLFGWVGNSSTSLMTAPAMYGISNSTTSGDYGSQTNEALKSDWGNTIGFGWRTLTGGSGGEWEYLFNTRSASTVNSTANARFAKAHLFGTTYGIILFPDSYTHPDGIAAPTGINATDNTSWNANTYSADDWAKMEAAGCVFLPVAGEREGTKVNRTGSYGSGYYWSSTYGLNSSQARCVEFYSGNLYLTTTGYRHMGYSVRLVRDAN